MDRYVNEFDDAHSEEDEDSTSGDESSGPSDEESESGDEEEDGESEENEEIKDELVATESTENNATVISDEDMERDSCPVCLNRFVGQELGTPENCEHTFCFECIQEWSKNINTCPIDRTEFNYIRLRNTPGGKDLKKVKVKVLPKEAEDALQESVTQCEVCHSGDREDRLLLCDGCDLAYHCECLDPPLFYIPIEEWFCPPCSGVFQNGAVAGPSRSRVRRVIPRTRVSEAVRSRVQNLRTITPRSVSSSSRKSATPVKRRKRRTYRRSYKKVVQLARTKKSMSDAGKGKLSARGATIVVTYKRKRRKRRKCGKKKLSKKSLASSRALPGPSAQYRIAKRLGISKPVGGSSMPQVKKPTFGSRAVARMDSMPSHSLFGNRNQLMDFSENFSEEILNKPSTSSCVSTNIRSSEENAPSTSSCVNILDSIMAGQKLLHAKSDNVVIKTDGSLIIKDSGSNIKRVEPIRKPKVGGSSHTPMSIALAKEGVKSTVLSAAKIPNTSHNNRTERTSKLKGNSNSEPSLTTIISKSKGWINKQNTPNSSNNKRFERPTNAIDKFNGDNCKESSSSTWKIPEKNQSKSKKYKECEAANEDSDNLKNNWESALSNSASTIRKNRITNISIKKELGNLKMKSENSDVCSRHKSKELVTKESEISPVSQISNSPNINEKHHNISYIKREILSDDETNSNLSSGNIASIRKKQEFFSHEDFNANCVVLNENINKEQKAFLNCITVNVKQETNESDSETDASGYCIFSNENNNDSSESENEYDASQSILDSIPNNSSISSLHEKCKSKTPRMNIKEEVPSDTEECSQSLVSLINDNSESENNSQFRTNNANMASKLPEDDLCEEEGLPCTQIEPIMQDETVSNSKSIKDSSSDTDDSLNSADEFSPTQINIATMSEAHLYNVESSDEEIPPTQVDFLSAYKLSKSSSCASGSNILEDELPATQLNSVFLKPFPVPSSGRDSLNVKTQNNISTKNKPENQFATQNAPVAKFCNGSGLWDKSSLKPQENSLPYRELEELPETQILNVTNDIGPDTQFNMSVDSDLPVTEIVAPDSLKDVYSHETVLNNNADCLATQPATATFNAAENESFTLPATQILDESEKEISSVLPATQISDESEKEISSTLPATQVLDESEKVLSSTLPSTQIMSSNVCYSTQILNTSVNEKFLPATHTLETDACENSSLPCTQIFNENITEQSHNSFNNCEKLPPSNQVVNPDSSKNMIDIISNIKQIVSSLSNNSNVDGILSNHDDINERDKCSDMSECISDSEIPEKDSSSSDSLTTENALNKTNDNNDVLDKNLEKVQGLSDTETEEFSPEKIKELLSKTKKKEYPKKVCVHKHLPQVITVKSAKQQLKPKLPNRKTFSFEEVAKLEGFETLENSFVNTEQKVCENVNFVNSNDLAFNDLSNTTQTAELERHKNSGKLKPIDIKRKVFENDVHILQEENGELPATQIMPWTEIDLPETQITLNDVKSNNLYDREKTIPLSKSKINNICSKTQSLSFKLPKVERYSFSTDNDNCDLPPTQICNLSENTLFEPSKRVKKGIDNLSGIVESILPAIQINNFKENNSFKQLHKIKKEIVLKDNESNPPSTENSFDENSLPATQINNFTEKNSCYKTSSIYHTSNCDSIAEQDKSLNLVDSIDLPATQILDDLPSDISNKVAGQLSNKNDKSVSLRELFESNSCSKNTSKNQHYERNKRTSEFNLERNKNHNGGSKRLHECEKDDKEFKRPRNNGSFSKKSIHTSVQPCKIVKENIISNVSSKLTIDKSVFNNVKQDSSCGSNKKQIECSYKTNQFVPIKQEKIDEFKDFLHTSKHISNSSNHTSQCKVLNIKLESPDEESLPPTQINFELFENDSLPPTQILSNDQTEYQKVSASHGDNNIASYLAPVKIKKEVLSDDEVCVIEVKTHPNVKEEIILDDDDDGNLQSSVQNENIVTSLNSTISSENISIKVELDIENSDKYINEDGKTNKNYSKPQSERNNLDVAASDIEKYKSSVNCASTKLKKLKHVSESRPKHQDCRSRSIDVEKHNKLHVHVSSKEGNSKPKMGISISQHKDSSKYANDCKSKSNNIKKCRNSADSATSKDSIFRFESNHRDSGSYTRSDEKCNNSTKSVARDENKSKHISEVSKSDHGGFRNAIHVGKQKNSKGESKLKHDFEISKSKHRDSKNSSIDIEVHTNLTHIISSNDKVLSKHKHEYSELRSKLTDSPNDSVNEETQKNFSKKSKFDYEILNSRSKNRVSKDNPVRVENSKISTQHDSLIKKHKPEHCREPPSCSDHKDTKSSLKENKKCSNSIDSEEKHKQKSDKALSSHLPKYRDPKIISKNFEKQIKGNLSSGKSNSRLLKLDSLNYETKIMEIIESKMKEDSNQCSSKEDIKQEKYKSSAQVSTSKNVDTKMATTYSNHLKDSDSSRETQLCKKQLNGSSVKNRVIRNSSEKENNSFLKTNHNSKEVIINLKSKSTKRSLESKKQTDVIKKLRYDESSNSEHCSDIADRLSSEQTDSIVSTDTNQSMILETNCDTNDGSLNYSPKSPLLTDILKVNRKQELKEEIANEVKLVLKPFYSTGLINKNDYKDIMRRAVPKVFMNCHNCINPEKIRKLVLSYVSFLHKS